MSDSENRQQTDAITPFPSFSALRVAHSNLLQSNFEPDDNEQHLAEVKEFVDRAQATGAFLSSDEERRSAQSMLNYWVTALYRVDNAPRKAVLVDYKPELIPGLADEKPPYPGVRAFTEDESNIFFGRQRQIDYLFSRLKEDRLIAIVGPAGSGKSSLVLAGLLPALKKDEPNSGKRNYFPPTMPGSNPLANLALMIKGFHNEATDSSVDSIEGFKQDKQHLLKLIEKKSEFPAVLIIENFEEIFTLCKDKNVRQTYIDNLLSVIQTPGIRHIVILTMRSDNLFDFEMRWLPEFRKLLEPAKVLLSMLGASELRDAIEKPAALVGVKFDDPVTQESESSDSSGRLKTRDSTVQALIKEVVSESIGLPLLQFSLLKLWAKREGNQIPDNPFPEINSYHEMLADDAEKLFNSLDAKQQRIARRILLQLFTIDDQSKITTYLVLRKNLYRISDMREHIDQALGKLVEAQVLRFTKSEESSDQQVELIQPSLIRTWARIRKWDEERKSKRRRLLAVGIMAGALLVAGTWHWLQPSRIASPLGKSETENLSIELARKSASFWQSKRIELAILLGLEAYDIDKNLDSRSNLLTYLQFASQPKEFLYKEGFDPDSVIFNRDSSKLASCDTKNGRVVLWDVNARQEISEFNITPGNDLTVFSNDSRMLASIDEVGALTLWDVNDGHRISTILEDKTWCAAFSPDDKKLASCRSGGSLILWDITQPEEPKQIYEYKAAIDVNDELDVNDAAFNSDGTRLAAGLDDGTIILLDTRQGKVIKTLKEPPTQKGQMGARNSIYSISFNPDNKLLATGRKKDAAIWEIETGQLKDRFTTEHNSSIVLAPFSHDGKTVAGLSDDGTIVLWDVAAHKQIGQHLYKSIDLRRSNGDFSSDNKTLASGTKNGIILLNVVDPRPATEFTKDINGVAFSPDGKTLALGLSDNINGGEIILWDTTSNRQVSSLTIPITGVLSVAFSHDGKTIAGLLGNGPNMVMCYANASNQYQCQYPIPMQFQNESSVSKMVALSFSTDDKQLLLFTTSPGNNSGILHILDPKISDTNSLNELKSIVITATTPGEKGNDIVSAAFSTDGGVLAVGNNKGRITFYTDLESNRHGDSIKEQSGSVSISTLAFGSSILASSTESALIALTIGSSDSGHEPNEPNFGNIILRDEKANKQITELQTGSNSPISSLALSREGRFLASASADNTLILWDLDVESAKKRLCSVINRNLTKMEWHEYLASEPYRQTCPEKPPGEGAEVGKQYNWSDARRR